jgi:hypothetical protein
MNTTSRRQGRGPIRLAEMEEIPMSTDKNVQTVKDFLAAIGRGCLSHRLIGEKRS